MRYLLLLALWADTARGDGGFSTEADLGATFFAGRDAGSAAAGPSFGAHASVGPLSWLSFGVVAAASLHEATVPPPPKDQIFQLFRVGGELRLGLRAGHIGLFLAPAVGTAWVSSNVLDGAGVTRPDAHRSFFAGGAAGLEWHTENPRFAFGLAGEGVVLSDFNDLTAVSVHAYLRYTKGIW